MSTVIVCAEQKGLIMSGYTKIFSTILDSTVWELSKEARLLWITMLVKKDRNQVVISSIGGLAREAVLTREEVERALEELSRPDPESRSKEFEGRRIVPVEGGWFVVNGAKYRDMLSKEERREYKRAWQAEYREKKRQAALNLQAPKPA